VCLKLKQSSVLYVTTPDSSACGRGALSLIHSDNLQEKERFGRPHKAARSRFSLFRLRSTGGNFNSYRTSPKMTIA
jgi:hypothetical protein